MKENSFLNEKKIHSKLKSWVEAWLVENISSEKVLGLDK